MTYEKLAPILEKIKKHLPAVKNIYASTRVTDIKNKTVGQLKALKEMGLREISLGVESGDDATLKLIEKGYTSEDILEQCHKLEDAGIEYWMTFLNGVGGREHSHDHAVNSAKIFNKCKPMVVGTGGFTLFPGTSLEEDVRLGTFTLLSEKEMLEELKAFVQELECDCSFITHHTVSGKNLTGKNFLQRKAAILESLDKEIKHGNMDALAAERRMKRSL